MRVPDHAKRIGASAFDELSARLRGVDDPHPDPGDLRPAAVLALLLPPRDEPRLLFIERAAGLRAHGGQVAFPGGKVEPGDATLLDTACREAREEVGLQGTPEILGRLDPVPTPTGFLIVPYVGWAPEPWQPRITSGEVARLLAPSVTELADPAVHRMTGRGVWRGFRYEMHEYAVHDPPIWGATARMVWDLLQRIERCLG
jgi:8-oxo-dGTP pyrophosphatase MutT (NUDIX family)